MNTGSIASKNDTEIGESGTASINFNRDTRPFMENSHSAAAKENLVRLGFSDLQNFILSPENQFAEPIAVCTGLCVAEFDAEKHIDTETKQYYKPTGKKHILNQSASVAVRLLDEGRRVIMFTDSSKEKSLKKLIKLHPNGSLGRVISAQLDSFDLIEKLYATLATELYVAPASRIDFVVYDSFMPYLSPGRKDRPFVPVYEEEVRDMQRMVAGRIEFLHWIGNAAYDLTLNRGQQELRLLLITSLASRRAAGNLYVDALHKGVSTIFLETLTKEIRLQGICDRFYGIEPAPGVVDRGAYDSLSIRQATIENSHINGFPYLDVNENDITTFPQMNPKVFGELCSLYLSAKEGEDLTHKASPELLKLLSGGRTLEELDEVFSGLIEKVSLGLDKVRQGFSHAYEINIDKAPAYILNSNMLGGLPPLKKGYTFIPMSPQGQYF